MLMGTLFAGCGTSLEPTPDSLGLFYYYEFLALNLLTAIAKLCLTVSLIITPYAYYQEIFKHKYFKKRH